MQIRQHKLRRIRRNYLIVTESQTRTALRQRRRIKIGKILVIVFMRSTGLHGLTNGQADVKVPDLNY